MQLLRWVASLLAATVVLAASAQAVAPSNPANGEPKTDATAASSTAVPGVSTPGFVFTLRMLEDGVFPGTLKGLLDVKNTQTKTIYLTKATLTPYGRLGGVYGATEIVLKELSIGPQLTGPAIRSDFTVSRSPTLFDMATARTGPAEFIVALEYLLEGNRTVYRAQAEVTAGIGTTPLYVFLGGAVGAVLLVLFIWSNKVLEHAKAGTLGNVLTMFWTLSVKWAFLFVAYAISGMVVALILWILANGLTAFQLPIAFQLRDFSGGLIVGLFSGMLAKTIMEKLSPT